MLNNFISQCLNNVRQSYSINFVRVTIAYLRFIYFVKILGRLKTYETHSDNIGSNTISHNLKGLKDLAVNRSLKIIRPVSVIDSLHNNSDILVIGPRTEGEILNLLAYGFSKSKIRGLDLISYSPWIDVGDMHNMPYGDNTWDLVISGWVILYSNNMKKAASEMIRVARNGSFLAVGLEYDPRTDEEISNQLGYLPGTNERLNSVSEVLELFGDNVDKIYFSHDVLEKHKNKIGNVIVIFSIKK